MIIIIFSTRNFKIDRFSDLDRSAQIFHLLAEISYPAPMLRKFPGEVFLIIGYLSIVNFVLSTSGWLLGGPRNLNLIFLYPHENFYGN